VDPEARHGHKTSARGFDGYKGHIAIDPDSEVIVASDVTPGNVGDGQAAGPLIEEALAAQANAKADGQAPVEVYGDASYGTADIVDKLEEAGIEANVKVQEPSPPAKGLFGKSAFAIDLDEQTVCCPQGIVVQIRLSKAEGRVGIASFGSHCKTCPQRANCTTSKEGRVVRIHPKEKTLQQARARQRDPAWKKCYRATRPKVERKFGHMMRRRHGGRCARVRGCLRVRQDFALLCAASNLKRLAVLNVRHDGGRWAI
jgi:hypothetical protein